MTCHNLGGVIACGWHPSGRLHLDNRYVWVEFHPYCGPSFTWDKNQTKEYIPKDENDPIWPVFQKWYDKNEEMLNARSKSAGF